MEDLSRTLGKCTGLMRHSQVVLLAEEREIQNSAPGGAHKPDLDNPNLELICHSYCIPHTCPYT